MSAPASIAVLSFVTTLHVAAFLLLSHRRAGRGRRVLLLPTVAFAVLAWLLTTPAWLLAGLAAQLAWVVACERLLAGGSDEAGPAAAAPAPAASSRAAAVVKPAASAGFVPVKVLSVVDETPEIRTFRMERPAGFAFRAGQFLVVRVAAGGKDEVRCYSISSAPEAAGYLEISVRRQGRASGALHETVRAGGGLPIRGPGGSFVYPEERDTPIVLHAGGVGITPMISMLRHAVLNDPGRPVTFLYTVRTEADVAFRDELAVVARRAPGVRVYVTLTRGEPTRGFLTGRMDAGRIATFVPDPAKAIHMICGPAPMIASLREALAGLGVPPGQVRFEAFEAAVASASEEAGGGAEHALRLARSGLTASVDGATSLLDAAEAAGASIDSMCRAGNCGTCRTRLLSGKVHDPGTALSAAERENGWILPCVARATGDCVLDA
ncbi:MAG: 2Fe-2S iron-sulfur cluster-binding protein [Thermoanaerobaculia bacterium]